MIFTRFQHPYYVKAKVSLFFSDTLCKYVHKALKLVTVSLFIPSFGLSPVIPIKTKFENFTKENSEILQEFGNGMFCRTGIDPKIQNPRAICKIPVLSPFFASADPWFRTGIERGFYYCPRSIPVLCIS